MNRMATRRRFVVRHAATLHPFVWRGLLPALALLALLWFAFVPFAKSWIEAAVAREVRTTLDAGSMRWVDVAVAGQHVTLSGTPPSADAGEAAVQAARATTCRTWAGNWTCPAGVDAQFAQASQAAPAPLPAPAPRAAAPAATSAQAKACERTLAELMSQSQILFDSATATLDKSNRGLLDRLAAAARKCPGVVRVQGHTDSKGGAKSNQELSEARAAAVRDALLARGLAPDKVVAEGYGETRPLARNSTRDGRAANRRIEFRADE